MNQQEQALFLTLYYLDDDTLLQACQVNNRFYQRVCETIWLNRLRDNLGLSKEDADRYKGDRTYAEWYMGVLNKVPNTNEGWLNNVFVRAAADGRTILVKAALHRGADVHDGDDQALIFASQNNHIEVVEILLVAGADPTTGGSNQALQFASENGNAEIVKLLIDAGADPEGGSFSPLIEASINKQTEVVKLLLAAGIKNPETIQGALEEARYVRAPVELIALLEQYSQ